MIQSVCAMFFNYQLSFANFKTSKKLNKDGFEPPIFDYGTSCHNH